MPPFFRQHAALHDDLTNTMRRRAEATATLSRLGIAGTRLGGEATTITAMIELLERHRRIRR